MRGATSNGEMSGQVNKRAKVSAVQAVLAVLVIIGVGWLVFKLVGYYQAQQVYHNIRSAYATQPSEGANDAFSVDFAALQERYPDVVGWVKMDDVDVSYPIVQSTDNDHYLHYDPSGAASIDGSIFLDYRNKSLDADSHCLVYGHNMLDESMFGQLDGYTDQQFYQRGSSTFTLCTPAGSYRYKIFAVNIVDPSDDTYTVGFTNTQVFDAFVRQLKERSMYDTGVEVSGSDHVVTLSTCSDTNRLVLCAKRL